MITFSLLLQYGWYALGRLARLKWPLGYDDWFYDRPEREAPVYENLESDSWNDDFMGWLCVCGKFEESEFHCSECGAEPPWGCDCGACVEDEWLDDWEDDYIYGPNLGGDYSDVYEDEDEEDEEWPYR